jgi:hypothetical protein
VNAGAAAAFTLVGTAAAWAATATATATATAGITAGGGGVVVLHDGRRDRWHGARLSQRLAGPTEHEENRT